MILTKECSVCGREFEKPKTVSMRVWVEERKCCSITCGHALKRGRRNSKLGDATRGKKQPPEVVAKRAESIRATYAAGGVQHARANLGLRREQTTQWKGDAIGYRAAHTRLYSHFGPITSCSECGAEVGPFEWALKDDAAVVLVAESGRFAGRSYSPQLEDYAPMCQPCHREYDGVGRDPRSGQYL